MSSNENADVVDLVSHSGSSASDENGSDEDDESSAVDESWISWFCNLNGNIFFCNIEKTFIEDSFNLFGLKQYLSKDFNRVLDTILDKIDNTEEPDSEDLSRSAAVLYGLIHARYIITSNGMEAMHKKLNRKDFGECPRYYCKGQAVLPMGITDEPKHSILKLFCPKCRDIYHCNPNQRHIDGAYFGTTFPHLFLMTYERSVPLPPTQSYVPRIFGFKIHNPLSGDRTLAPSQSSISLSAYQQHLHTDVEAQSILPVSDIGNAVNSGINSLWNSNGGFAQKFSAQDGALDGNAAFNLGDSSTSMPPIGVELEEKQTEAGEIIGRNRIERLAPVSVKAGKSSRGDDVAVSEDAVSKPKKMKL